MEARGADKQSDQLRAIQDQDEWGNDNGDADYSEDFQRDEPGDKDREGNSVQGDGLEAVLSEHGGAKGAAQYNIAANIASLNAFSSDYERSAISLDQESDGEGEERQQTYLEEEDWEEEEQCVDPQDTIEMLRSKLLQTLKTSGTLDYLKAQIRSKFIEQVKASPSMREAKRSAITHTLQEQVANSVVVEFLTQRRMMHTLSVFIPEAYMTNKVLGRTDIAEALHLTPGSNLYYLMTGKENQELDHRDLLSLKTASEDPVLHVLMKQVSMFCRSSGISIAVQTEEGLPNHREELQIKLEKLEEEFLRRSNAAKEQPLRTIEERMLKYQREVDERSKREVVQELERLRQNEISAVRLEEAETYRRKLDAMITQYDEEYNKRKRRLQEKEEELIALHERKEKDLQSELFTIRQQLISQLDRGKLREEEAVSKYEKLTETLHIQMKKYSDLQADVSRREREVTLAAERLERRKQTLEETLRAQILEDLDLREKHLSQRSTKIEAMEHEIQRKGNEISLAQAAVAQEREQFQQLRSQHEDLSHKNNELLAKFEALHKTHHEVKELLDVSKKEYHDQQTAFLQSKQQNAELHGRIQALQHEATEVRRMLTAQGDAHEKQMAAATQRIEVMTSKLSEKQLAFNDQTRKLKDENRKLLEHEIIKWQTKSQEWLNDRMHLEARLQEALGRCSRLERDLEDEKVQTTSAKRETEELRNLLATTRSAINAIEDRPAVIRSGSLQRLSDSSRRRTRTPSWRWSAPAEMDDIEEAATYEEEEGWHSEQAITPTRGRAMALPEEAFRPRSRSLHERALYQHHMSQQFLPAQSQRLRAQSSANVSSPIVSSPTPSLPAPQQRYIVASGQQFAPPPAHQEEVRAAETLDGSLAPSPVSSPLTDERRFSQAMSDRDLSPQLYRSSDQFELSPVQGGGLNVNREAEDAQFLRYPASRVFVRELVGHSLPSALQPAAAEIADRREEKDTRERRGSTAQPNEPAASEPHMRESSRMSTEGSENAARREFPERKELREKNQDDPEEEEKSNGHRHAEDLAESKGRWIDLDADMRQQELQDRQRAFETEDLGRRQPQEANKAQEEIQRQRDLDLQAEKDSQTKAALHEEERRLHNLREDEERARRLRENEVRARRLREDEERARKLREDEERAPKLREDEERGRKLRAEEERAQKLHEEEERAQRLREEEERAQRLREEEERAQRLREQEEIAQRLREEEEKAQRLREEEERAQRLREQEEIAQRLREEEERAQRLHEEKEKIRKEHEEEERIRALQAEEERTRQLDIDERQQKLRAEEEQLQRLRHEEEMRNRRAREEEEERQTLRLVAEEEEIALQRQRQLQLEEEARQQRLMEEEEVERKRKDEELLRQKELERFEDERRTREEEKLREREHQRVSAQQREEKEHKLREQEEERRRALAQEEEESQKRKKEEEIQKRKREEEDMERRRRIEEEEAKIAEELRRVREEEEAIRQRQVREKEGESNALRQMIEEETRSKKQWEDQRQNAVKSEQETMLEAFRKKAMERRRREAEEAAANKKREEEERAAREAAQRRKEEQEEGRAAALQRQREAEERGSEAARDSEDEELESKVSGGEVASAASSDEGF